MSASALADEGPLPLTPGRIVETARPKAVRQLLTSAQNRVDPFLRANAIEAMQVLPKRALPLAQLGLEDKHPAVRFAALVTIGNQELKSLGETVKRYLNDPSPSVRAAAMYAASQCGLQVDISEMARMLVSDNPTLRGNVVMLIGLMGDSSALPMLEELAVRRMRRPATRVQHAIVRLQIAEARVKLGDDEAVSAIRGSMYSSFQEVRILAVLMLGRLGDMRMEEAMFNMLRRADIHPIELRLAAAETLARSNRPVVIKEVLSSADSLIGAAVSGLFTVRTQSAMALGSLERACAMVRPQLLSADPPDVRVMFADLRVAQTLVSLLDDPEEQVRLAAAAALLQPAADRFARGN